MPWAAEGGALEPEHTQDGRLPPWEAAKAEAYDSVIKHISSHLDQTAAELLGERVDSFIARHLALKGGATTRADDGDVGSNAMRKQRASAVPKCNATEQ